MTKSIKISTARDHRRGGMAHPQGTHEYPVDHFKDFSKEQLKALHEDPELVITEVDGKPDAEAEAAAKADAKAKAKAKAKAEADAKAKADAKG